jgi:hypothetical protein
MHPEEKLTNRWAVRLLIVLTALAVAQVAWSWNAYFNVSTNIGASYAPAIAIDNTGIIHVVWADNSLSYPAQYQIVYRRSSDGGATWSTPQILSNGAFAQSAPVIAAATPNAIVVAWRGSGTIARVWNGQVWLPPTQLSLTTARPQRLSAAINQSGIALVGWSEGSGAELYGSGGPPPTGYLYSRWNGTSWITPIPSTGRLVAMRGATAFLATSEGTLLRSNDAGATWSAPIVFPAGYIVPDAMAIDSNDRLAMAWYTSSGIRTGIFDGVSFSTPLDVTSWTLPNPYRRLGISVNGSDHIGLIWTETEVAGDDTDWRSPRSSFRVMASVSTDGTAWSPPERVTSQGACSSAIGGSPTSAVFYGVWQSPDCGSGEAPDVFIAAQSGGSGQSYSIEGRVRTASNEPLAGVTVSVTGSGTLSGADGTYRISGLRAGEYTLTATRNGYSFAAIAPIVVPPNRTGVDLIGTLLQVGISGRVVDNNNTPLSDVLVVAEPGNHRAITGSDGTYTIANLPPGTYQLTSTRSGYRFTGPLEVIITSQGITGQDFVGTLVEPLTITGFAAGGYAEQPKCYDIYVIVRNNTKNAITQVITLQEFAQYKKGDGTKMSLPLGRVDRRYDCETGQTLDAGSNLQKQAFVPANSTLTYRFRIKHDWEWIEKRTVPEEVIKFYTDVFLSVVSANSAYSNLAEVIQNAQGFDALLGDVANSMNALPTALYSYQLATPGIASPPQQVMEVEIDQYRQGYLRGSLGAGATAFLTCVFAREFWTGFACGLYQTTSVTMYFMAYGSAPFTNASLSATTTTNSYTELAEPDPITHSALASISDPVMRNYAESHLEILALQRASQITFGRARMAFAAGDLIWERKQLDHLRLLHIKQQVILLQIESYGRTLLPSVPSLTPPEVQQLKTQLEPNGFPNEMAAVMREMGLDDLTQQTFARAASKLWSTNWPTPTDAIAAPRRYSEQLDPVIVALAASEIYVPVVLRP